MRKIFFISQSDFETDNQVSGVFVATENSHKAVEMIKQFYPDYMKDINNYYTVNELKEGQVWRLQGLKVIGRVLATDELAHVLKRVIK